MKVTYDVYFVAQIQLKEEQTSIYFHKNLVHFLQRIFPKMVKNRLELFSVQKVLIVIT